MFYQINSENLREEIIDGLAYQQEILTIKNQLVKDPNSPSLHSRLGELYRIGGNLILSESHQIVALQYLQRNSRLELKFLIFLRLAITYHHMGEIAKSQAIYDKLFLCQTINKWKDFLYQHRGKLSFDSKDYTSALYYFKQAKALRRNNSLLIASSEIAIRRTKEMMNLE